MYDTWERVERFQSTLPRGERPTAIHGGSKYQTDFNPRSREGSDIPNANYDKRERLFQSTLPRGERPPATQRESTG